MRLYFEKIIKIIGYLIVAFFFATGVAHTFFELQPFWLDEWFIIHNIKFKPANFLWGSLDYMQQFPRVYLQVVKQVSNCFSYSYTSLRIVSFLVHVLAIFLCFNIGNKLFKENVLAVFVWVLIYISFKTSLHYFVQIKQYTMEMALGVVAIWQLITIHRLFKGEGLRNVEYFFLYMSMGAATFFSYTYPIVVAPLYLLVLIRVIAGWNKLSANVKLHSIALLAISITSVLAFYKVDVQQVLQDNGMQNYWHDFLLKDGFDTGIFFEGIYKLFAHMGSGGLFEVVFAVLGIAGWLYGIYRLRKHIFTKDTAGFVYGYATVLIGCVILLFVMGKLPVGIHRLNAFATPAIGLLVVGVLMQLSTIVKMKKVVTVLYCVLFLALGGNIVSSYINDSQDEQTKKEFAIYENVTEGLRLAHEKHLPVIADKSMTYPYDAYEEISGDWVITTYPAYDVGVELSTYTVADSNDVLSVLSTQRIAKAVYINATSHNVVTLD